VGLPYFAAMGSACSDSCCGHTNTPNVDCGTTTASGGGHLGGGLTAVSAGGVGGLGASSLGVCSGGCGSGRSRPASSADVLPLVQLTTSQQQQELGTQPSILQPRRQPSEGPQRPPPRTPAQPASGPPTPTAEVVAPGPKLTDCPICYAVAADVEQLPHKTRSGDVSSHRACRKCREELVKRNAPCPWCRTEMVWQTVFGVLDGLKGAARGFRDGQHDELANLMGMWQEYEMVRTQSDICLFAREMATDAAVVSRLEGAMATSSGWLRDSIGLWIRFFSLYADGEVPELSFADGERLRRAVDAAIDTFERDHGGHPDFVGAMYQQAAVAVLSASFSGLSTRTAAAQARRVGEASLRVYRRHYGAQPRSVYQVRERLNRDYVEAVSTLVWGSEGGGDPILRAFFATP